MAASATFALKLGVWFRRARLLMVSPDSRAHRARRQAETPLSVLCRFPEPALGSISSTLFPTLFRWQGESRHLVFIVFATEPERACVARASEQDRPVANRACQYWIA